MSEREFLDRLAFGPISIQAAVTLPLPKGTLSRLMREGKIMVKWRRDALDEMIAKTTSDPAVWARTVRRCYVLAEPEFR